MVSTISPIQKVLSPLNDSKISGQTTSFWAGNKYQGPIQPHEQTQSYETKLQNSWYGGGLFGPRQVNGTHRMIWLYLLKCFTIIH